LRKSQEASSGIPENERINERINVAEQATLDVIIFNPHADYNELSQLIEHRFAEKLDDTFTPLIAKQASNLWLKTPVALSIQSSPAAWR
jgi:hypothetical protein